MPGSRGPSRLARRGGCLLFGAALVGAALSACDNVYLNRPERPSAPSVPVGTPMALFNSESDAGPAGAPASVEAAIEPAAGPEPAAAAPAPAQAQAPSTLLPQPVAVAAMMGTARSTLADATRLSREAAPHIAVAFVARAVPDTAALTARDRMQASREFGPGSIGIATTAAPGAAPAPLATNDLAADDLDSVIAALTSADPAAAAALGEPADEDALDETPAGDTVLFDDAAFTEATAPSGGREGDLTGLTDAEVQMLLGPPLSVRRDAPAEAWQYATSDCILDLFFYQDTGLWRVAHIEARTIAALDAPADACVRSVLAVRVVANGQS